MFCKRELALIAAWAGFLFGTSPTPLCAQEEWITTLNAATSADSPALPASITTVATLPDGSTYFAGRTSCCTQDIRVVLLSPTGAKIWERWIDGGYQSDSQIPLVVQSDDSVVVLYRDYCMALFSRSGDKLVQTCASLSLDSGNRRYAALPDGDIIVVGGSRTLVRFAPTGQIRWQARDAIPSSYETIVAFGMNSDGNYYEITTKRFRVWRATDGDLIINVAQNTPCCTDIGLRSFPSVATTDGSIVTLESVYAGKATITKYSNNGSVIWRQSDLLPFYDYDPTGWFLRAVSDGSGDVLYASSVDATIQLGTVARISAGGTVVWQRKIDGISRVAKVGSELLAIGTTISNSVFTLQAFPVNEANGVVGGRRVYSQPSHPPDPLFRQPAPQLLFTSGALVLRSYWPSASLKFLDSHLAERWVHALTYPIAAGLGSKACPAKQLVRSTSGDWWTHLSISPFSDGWVRVGDSNGAIGTRGPLGDAECGFAMTSDDGLVLVSEYPPKRVQKIDSTGTVVWTTPGNLSVDGYFGLGPTLIATHSDGDVVYSTREILGRVSSTGLLRYERKIDEFNAYNTSRSLLQIDNTGNSIIYGYQLGFPVSGAVIARVDRDGTVLSSAIYPTICDQLFPTLLPDGEILVASCGAVHRVGVDGSLRWSRNLVQPLSLGTNVSSVTSDSLGNVFVGGCFRSTYYDQEGFGGIVISSWNSAGVERWQRYERAAFNASQCISALAPDHAGGVYASVVAPSSQDVRGETFLAHFDSSGRELWRHADILGARFVREADIALGADGFLRILAAEGGSEFAPARVTLRKVDPALLASRIRLRFLEAPGQTVPYRGAFRFRIGIVSADGSPQIAQSPVNVRIGVHEGVGIMVGKAECRVPMGSSSCTVENAAYSELDPAATFWASADGLPTIVSPPISFGKSPTSTTVSVVGSSPYVAYTYRRVAFSVLGASAAAARVSVWPSGDFDGSFNEPASELYDCRDYSSVTSQLSLLCNFLVRSAPPPLHASYVAPNYQPASGHYGDSTAAPLSISVQKVTPTIRVEADSDNIFVQGEPLLLRVALFVPNGVNVTKFVATGALRANGVECAAPIATGTVQDGFAGSFSRCSVVATSSGNFPVSLSFAGSDDLLPINGGAYTIAISPRAELRGTGSFAAGTQACATSVRTRCTVSDTGNWQCVGPEGMTGRVFFQPPTGSGGHYSASPVQFSNVTSVQSVAGGVAYVASATSCSLDVDGDGARMGHTDGILILRRMLGLADAALTVGATHSCAPRSATSIASAINLSAYDIDGDGQARAETDGLLLLRAMLGFRGDALVNGAISTTATRRNAQDIQNFLLSNCSYNLN